MERELAQHSAQQCSKEIGTFNDSLLNDAPSRQ
jgi:hypothetical protein